MKTFVRLLVVLCCSVPAVSFADIVADSAAEFSENQGQDGWVNGYYDLGNDSDGTYSTDDFQIFEGPDWIWNGSKWDEANADADNVPWTEIGPEAGHPNGPNSGGLTHYAVRRWVSDVSGSATVTFTHSDSNPNCGGNGTTVLLFQNGDDVASSYAAGGDASIVTESASITLATGDIVDLALGSQDQTGDFADGCDGANFAMQIDVVPEPTGFAMIGFAVLGLLGFRKK